ncbi:MAG: hypothetical protein IH877_09190 [Gemmatimonadetes bacterium]|nr:hypothetical protein [Gemmatimonadota bacterium]
MPPGDDWDHVPALRSCQPAGPRTERIINSLLVALQTQEPISVTTLLQAIWLGLAVVFVFSVFTAGFVAKKINNISGATYAKAFLATILKNVVGLSSIAFMFYLDINPIAALAVASTIVPIIIYRVVFGCPRFWEAILVWLPVVFVEVGLSYMLTLVGLISLGAAA